jgi:hypothetical protein
VRLTEAAPGEKASPVLENGGALRRLAFAATLLAFALAPSVGT